MIVNIDIPVFLSRHDLLHLLLKFDQLFIDELFLNLVLLEVVGGIFTAHRLLPVGPSQLVKIIEQLHVVAFDII